MKTNLSSQISLGRVSTRLFKPGNSIERSELTRFERIPTEIYSTADEAAEEVAKNMAKIIRQRQSESRTCNMVLAGGSTVTEVFQHLVKLYKEGLSFENVNVFLAYEFYPLPADSSKSNLQIIKEQFLDLIDIPATNIFKLDGTMPQEQVADHCQAYEKMIEALGGIDIALLGVGRMGNIALNVIGSARNSQTRLVFLDQMSRDEAVKIFGSEGNVPPCALTMGVSTLRHARKIFLLAWGEDKAAVVAKVVEGELTDQRSASFIQMHNNAQMVLDLGSAARLTRIHRPWLVTSCEWDDKLIRSAIVWLCGVTGKPILKLTNKDYNENGLGELLALYGSAYDVNIKIFNDLQHTITGWPGGKPNADDTNRPERATPAQKRVIIFSPHPDDDVISMGGTLQRLVAQNHDVHVAYETSGNIAVGDEEVFRFLHFVRGFNEKFGGNNEQIDKAQQKFQQFVDNKQKDDFDSRDILEIKALIRRGEARLASIYSGLKLDHVHFLNLPFYETGKIEKNPISEADVKIVRQLLTDVKPHQIFVAGDLADPHGTHRVCTDAVLAAIDLEKEAGAKWLEDCRIWMYRGAWAEWEIENIEMAVPISPEELRKKRNAILKHQSQMESAPFLGNDERLFWQRAEDRNHATAELYKDLGLAAYEAMEAFVQYHPL